jgi:radical SAM superfamily enzyme YgiQ (UPF0313 family)
MFIQNADAVIITDFQHPDFGGRAAGAYRIATELRQHNYTCQVIDCFTELTDEQKFNIFEKTIGTNTKIFGISSTFFMQNDKFTYNYPYSVEKMSEYFQFIKKINPNIKIVAGGGKTDFNNCPESDILITGLADKAIVEYMKYLQNSNPFFTFTTNKYQQLVVDGNYYNNYFDFNNSFIKYEPHDNIMINEKLPIEIARGCIFKCKFCTYTLNGKKKNDYIKTASVIKDEFLRNYHEYGITKYLYMDDTHNDNIVKLQQMADIVQSLPFKLEYAAYIRLDLMHAYPEQYQLLKDGGLKGTFFGIESLNYETAKSIGKGLHPDKIIEELYKFENTLPTVGTMAGFICGLPKETKESMQLWVDLISKEDFPIDAILLQPLNLSRNPDKLIKSEFEENTGNWYTWKGTSHTHWDNGNFDRVWAEEYCHQINSNIKTRQRIGGWSSILTSSKDECNLIKKSWHANMKTLLKIKNDFRTDYVNKLFN